MTDIAEDLDEVGIDFRVVEIDRVRPNEYNPNEMASELFESLANAIRAEGKMNQPLLVREDPETEGDYIIVDGENRWQAGKLAGLKHIGVVVVDYDDNLAKVRTLSFNNLKGQNVPIKLARMLVDLQKEYSDEEIRRMTGIREDDQLSALSLLDVPTFNPSEAVRVTPSDVERPIPVNLMLMPDEHNHYTAAMVKAMRLGGSDVTALIGDEVGDYNKALTDAMGMAGVKLRNVALAAICKAFNKLPDDLRESVCKEMGEAVLNKRTSDAEAKETKRQSADRKGARTRRRKRTR